MMNDNQNEMAVKCRLKFSGLPDYGHIIVDLKGGVRYELHVDQSTDVAREHLEELKTIEPHLIVED